MDRSTLSSSTPCLTSEDRATVVTARRTTPAASRRLSGRTPTPAPGSGPAVPELSPVEIDGRRHSRCCSPANAEGVDLIEFTVARHEMAVVGVPATARPGMTVGLSAPAGDFVLPRPRPRRLRLIAVAVASPR